MTKTTTTTTTLERFEELEDTLNAEIVERRPEVRALCQALVAGVPMFLLGPPGTAKSLLANRANAYIDGADKFEVLMTRFTQMEEVFGPVSLAGLKEDRFKRKLAGYLCTANIAFLDECLTGDNLILLPTGERVTLANAVRNDLVPVLTLADGTVTARTPLRTAHRPPQPVSKLVLNNGNTVRATDDHKFLVRRKGDEGAPWGEPTWVELQAIHPGDYVATPSVTPVFGSDALPDHEVTLLAAMIADGGLTREQIRYTKTDQDMVAVVREAVGATGDELVPIDYKGYRIRGRKQAVRSLMDDHGLSGKGSKEKFVPEAVFRLPKDQLARFLGLLWSGDGTVNQRISYASSSPVLAEQVQHLLRRFGIASRRYTFPTRKPSGEATTSNRVDVLGGFHENFRSLIGQHMVGEKRRTLMARDLTVKVSERRLRIEGDILWDKVVEVDPDGMEETFCFTMPDGNFIANDVVVKNCFKANSSILNALLWAINEGIYRDDTEIIDIPLHLLLCASNEMPQDDSLGALYDRLLFRFIVSPIRDQSAFLTMLRTNIPKHPEPILTWTDVIEAHEASKKVVITDQVLEAVAEIRKQLHGQGIEPTERRFMQSMKIVKAAAYLDGCEYADLEHLRPLQHVLWDDQEQIAKVSKVVLGVAAPHDNEAHQLLAEVEKLEASLNDIAQDDEKQRKGTEIHSKLRRCAKDLEDLKRRAGTSRRRSSETLVEVQDRLGALTNRVLLEVFNVKNVEPS